MKNIIKPLAKSALIPLGLTADPGIHKKFLGSGHNTTLGGFLCMLLGTLGASLLGNMLSGKGVIRAGEGNTKVDYGSKRSSFKKSFWFHHIL